MSEGTIAANLRTALVDALRRHDVRRRQQWSGIYHFREQNERIGHLVGLIDPFLRATGRWPGEKRYIGNDERLLLLRQIAEDVVT